MPSGKPKAGESLADLFPDVASEWHPTLNGDLTPINVVAGSGKKVWWKCDKGPDHEWETTVVKRTTYGRGCHFCTNKKASVTNSLASLFPDIASEWHPTKNGELTPDQVVAGTGNKFWWKCPEGPDHEWETTPHKRTGVSKTNCPYCTGQRVSVTNSLASLNPELALEWHPTKNGQVTPHDVTWGSNKKYWWKCSVAEDHEWEASVAERNARGQGCPCCAGKKVSVTNRLDILFPDVAQKWHPTKNGDLKPSQVIALSETKRWWRCDKGPDHEWEAGPASMLRDRKEDNLSQGCPFCRGLSVSVTNRLDILFPEIASEWHPMKNGDLKPNQVVFGYGKKVWWKCSVVPEHEWDATVIQRTKVGTGCPLCTLTPRSAQEIRLAYELSTLIDFDFDSHKVRIEGRLRDVDIVLENLGIVVEFDGAYWHRDKADNDFEKAQKLEAEGWNVIRVRERPLDSIHKNDVMVTTNAHVKEVADLVLQKIIELTGVKIPKLKEYLASDEPWREKEALVAIREYQAENARKKAERDAKRKSKKKS